MNRTAPLKLLVLLSFAAANAWSADPGSVLHPCTAIDTDSERLACYDKLAGRTSHPPPKPAAAQPAAGGGTPAASPDKPLSKETFGLYSSEHPAAPKGYPAVTAAVAGVTTDPSGLMLVSLEGGELWRIEGADPLLAKGDAVKIQRAKLGSFLLTTPSDRMYRAHRLK